MTMGQDKTADKSGPKGADRPLVQTMADLERRRRRAIYRANHRGTKELDILLGHYASAMVADMGPPALDDFEALLACEEPELQRWILYPETLAREASATGAAEKTRFSALIADIRGFHGVS